jgi:DNA polymerase III alpha subunit
MTEGYVELHASSAFSFLEGASQPEQLIERAVELGMPAMALLDRNGVYGSARFHTSAKRNGVRAHVGVEVSSLVSQWEWRGKTDTMAHSFQNAGFDVKHPRIPIHLWSWC